MELGDIIVTIGRILNNLEQIQEEKGVPNSKQDLIDNNINNSSLGKKKESSSLSGNERKKLKEVFSIFNESFFAYQKKQKEDTKPTTLISKLKKETTPKEPVAVEKKKLGLLDFLLPLIGGVALIGAAIPTLIASLFEKVGFAGDVMKVLGKVGLIGGLKLLAGTFLKRFALGALKRIPYLGGLISLYFAYKEFKAGRIIPGLLEIVSGLANFVPFVGPILSIGVDVLKAFLESQGAFAEGGALSNSNALGTIMGWMSNIGTWLWDHALDIPVLGTFKRLGMAWDAFKSGDWGEGLKQVLYGIISIIPGGGLLIRGFEWISSFLSASSEEQQAQINEGGVMGTIKGWILSIGTFMWDHALDIPILGTFKRFGMAWDAFKGGSWGEGLKQVLYGIISIIPGGGLLIRGFEWLSSFLSSSEKEQQPQTNEGGVMGTVKGWISNIGTFMWDHALNIPILGTFKRLGMAWEAFKSGDWGEGLKQVLFGFVSLFPAGFVVIRGFELLSSWLFGGDTEEEKSLSPDGSWKDRLKNWIKGKLHKLPAFLRKPLEWFGILDETGSEAGDNATTSAPNATSKNKGTEEKPKEEKGFFSKMADKVGKGLSAVGDFAGDMFSSLETSGKEAPDIGSALKSVFGGLYNVLSDIKSTILPEIQKITGNLINDISKPKEETSLQKITTGSGNLEKPKEETSLQKITTGSGNLEKPKEEKGAFSKITDNVKTQNDKEYLNKQWSWILKEHQRRKEKLTGKENNTFENNKAISFGQKKEKLTEKNDNIFKNDEAISVGQIIEQASLNECKYLEALVNIGNQTLTEMRKMNGSSGKGMTVIPQAPTMVPSSNKSRISLTDNRMGYADSVYTFG